tara:strand:- start:2581 stop:2715 length:135 start_codon:yes stop_codon:yes gene_type:complete
MNDNTTDTKLTDNIGQIDTTGMSCFGGLQEPLPITTKKAADAAF